MAVSGREDEASTVPLDRSSIPRHIAVVMDGNGRWALSRNLSRPQGHEAGAARAREIIEECHYLGVKYLTLFSFSSENWGRPKEEVQALMSVFSEQLGRELMREDIAEHGVRLLAIGDIDALPAEVRALLLSLIEATSRNNGLTVTMALSYGGRGEITHAARRIATEVAAGSLSPAEITEELFAARLWTAGTPDPDLLIRTGGEMRLSNFLLWQLSYAELVFMPEAWPDFDRNVLHRAISIFQQRERRFGGVGSGRALPPPEAAPIDGDYTGNGLGSR